MSGCGGWWRSAAPCQGTRYSSGNTRDIARASYISPRVIDHYMEGSVVAYYGELVEEIIAAEQGDLTEGEQALLELLKKKLRRELSKAA
ncbi:MAG: hypothetical protein LC714_00015 [Actinobacteria bacterium]|nr:hypothetical protein [Actinomycetota bacterium]